MRTRSAKSATVWFVAGILLITGTVLIWKEKVNAQLRHENRMLREEIQATKQAAEHDAATTQAKMEEEVRRLRAEAQEVHKLRNEVGQLRAQQSESERLRAENLRLKSAPRASDTSAGQGVQQPEYFAKENWSFTGYATPDASLQSFMWAMREGDLKTLQAGMTAQAQIAKGLGNEESAAKIQEGIRRKVRDTIGYRILERKSVSEDEIVFRIHATGEGSSTGDQNIVLKRLDGEWKVERSYRDAIVPP